MLRIGHSRRSSSPLLYQLHRDTAPLAESIAGQTMPVTGWECAAQDDYDFGLIDALMGEQPNMSYTYYANEPHGCGTNNTRCLHVLRRYIF